MGGEIAAQTLHGGFSSNSQTLQNTFHYMREWALLARYVYTYEEFVIVTEAPQCNWMTATGQDIDNNRAIYK